MEQADVDSGTDFNPHSPGKQALLSGPGMLRRDEGHPRPRPSQRCWDDEEIT